MTRIAMILPAAAVLAALSADAFAQVGCQPTITQPCTKTPPARVDNQPSRSSRQTGGTNDADETKDHTPRIRLDSDTDLKFGTGGLGIGRKF